MNLLSVLIIIALLMTVAILIMGVGSMAHGGEHDEKHSTQLMFARVTMQGITILLLFIAFYLANN